MSSSHMENRVVAGRYALRERIGAGSFGEIYSAEDLLTRAVVAVKLESADHRVPQVNLESKLYAILEGGVNIPRCYFHWEDQKHRGLAMDLLGPSLESVFAQCHRRFSLKTVLMIADQMLAALEFIHNRNFVHCDVKPENFVLGRDSRANQIFAIDFGLARRYRDPMTLEHIPYSDGRLLTGTARYASVRVLGGVEPTRRDDIESLSYVLCYFLRGYLPWMGIKGEAGEAKNARIYTMKKRMASVELCSGMPEEFRRFVESARSLRFADRPPYEEYRAMFRDLFVRSGYVFDYQFDWAKPETPRAPRTPKHPLAEKRKRAPVIHNPRLVPSPKKRGQNGKRRGNEMGRAERRVPLKELTVQNQPE